MEVQYDEVDGVDEGLDDLRVMDHCVQHPGDSLRLDVGGPSVEVTPPHFQSSI